VVDALAGGQRGRAERIGSEIDRGRGGDRHRDGGVHRADRRIGRANCWRRSRSFEVGRGRPRVQRRNRGCSVVMARDGER